MHASRSAAPGNAPLLRLRKKGVQLQTKSARILRPWEAAVAARHDSERRYRVSSSSPGLLKEEINKTQDSEHDLAKWKLAVTAALGAAAFGLSKESSTSFWLLFFVPFACAYVDLYDYQYRLRVLEIAKFLRLQHDDPVLHAYEEHCSGVRKGRNFDLGKWAGLGSSVGASLFGPVFYFLVPHGSVDTLLVPSWCALIIWGFGLLLVVALFLYFRKREAEL